MLVKSTELNAGIAMITFAFMLAVPNINIGLLGLNFSEFSPAFHTFARLGLLLITLNFLNNAANSGGEK